MKIEPNLDKSALVQRLQEAYGLAVDEMEFFPTGWLAYCYVLTCPDEKRFFLKIYSNLRPPIFAASSIEFYLPLSAELHAKGVLPHVPYPLRNRDGELQTLFGDYSLILTPFIAGKVVGFGNMNRDILAKLATSVGILHSSRPLLEIAHPHIEQFEIAFEDMLVEALDKLAIESASQSTTMRSLGKLLIPRTGEVLARLTRLKELQAIAASKNPPMVICHTDLHGENLILGDDGALYLLDWENALIAPREHDLFFFAAEADFWEVFLPSYEQVAGSIQIDGDLLRFYYYRRGLEDTADWIAQTLVDDELKDEHEFALDGIANILNEMGQIEATVAEITARDRLRRAG